MEFEIVTLLTILSLVQTGNENIQRMMDIFSCENSEQGNDNYFEDCIFFLIVCHIVIETILSYKG